MKISFYVVLGVLIYSMFGLFNNEFVNNHAFFITFIMLWGLSWGFIRFMPKTLTYEQALWKNPILEDIYTENVSSFSKRLSLDTFLEIITAIYFCIAISVIYIAVGISDWGALIIFAFFTIRKISLSIKFVKAQADLYSNPSKEECMKIATDIYHLDYPSYYEAHNGVTYTDMFPPKPRFFKSFQCFSLIIAICATTLGIFFLVSAMSIILNEPLITKGAFAGMRFLYASLAIYFGIKDTITISKKKPQQIIKKVQCEEQKDVAK